MGRIASPVVTGPVTLADLDALETPLIRWWDIGRVKTRLGKEFRDATRISGEEFAGAVEPVDRTVAQVRFAERLRTLAEEFAKVSVAYNAAVAEVDAPLRELLLRAGEAGFEPVDAAEIVESLAALAQLADIGRGQLERLDEVGRLGGRYPYSRLEERLTAIAAAVQLMDDQRPVLDEWKRQILLVMPSA